MANDLLLAGDVGGTKTNLAVYSYGRGLDAPLAEDTLHSSTFPSLDALARHFLTRTGLSVSTACFGVAGPVVDGHARVTNLPWQMDEAALAVDLGVREAHLLNDLESIAHAVPVLHAADLETIQEGAARPEGAIAVIAPGTGLGEAYLTWDGQRHRAHASEGGHADFAPTTAQELALLGYMQKKFTHVSYERVCSGIGIPHLYGFLKDSGAAPEPPWLAARLAGAKDVTREIMQVALGTTEDSTVPPSDLCTQTLDLFVSILGAQAGNLALTLLATGGVYLGGGIPPRMLALLHGQNFKAAFLHKGRFAELLQRVPVHVILNPKVALLGAASYGLTQMPA